MRYVMVKMEQVDRTGEMVDEGFIRYGIVDRANNNRIFFSTRSLTNLVKKFLSIIGVGTDDFNREDFERRVEELKTQQMSAV
jgi:hypothetical protein